MSSATVFDVGDRVVYPHHGAAVIERKEQRDSFGTQREYFVLHVDDGDLTLLVPADNTEEVGLRRVIDEEDAGDVFVVLARKGTHVPTSWPRRFKNHGEKLKSGDIYQVAEVVRNLSVRSAEKPLAAAETRMLATARRIVASELAMALAITKDEAERRIDKAFS
jgi:CarD family transcriptional regulator